MTCRNLFIIKNILYQKSTLKFQNYQKNYQKYIIKVEQWNYQYNTTATEFKTKLFYYQGKHLYIFCNNLNELRANFNSSMSQYMSFTQGLFLLRGF